MKIFQNNRDEVEKLRKSVLELEKKVAELEGSPINKMAKLTEDMMTGKFWKY